MASYGGVSTVMRRGRSSFLFLFLCASLSSICYYYAPIIQLAVFPPSWAGFHVVVYTCAVHARNVIRGLWVLLVEAFKRHRSSCLGKVMIFGSFPYPGSEDRSPNSLVRISM